MISSCILGLAIAYAGNKMSLRPELREAVDAGHRLMSFLETIRLRIGDDHRTGAGAGGAGAGAGGLRRSTHQSSTSNCNSAICDQGQDIRKV